MSDCPEFQNLIGGQMRSATSGALIDSVNPATGEIWARVPRSDRSDVDSAVEAAWEAFPAWAALSPDHRSAYLSQVADLFDRHGKELADLESTGNGNPLWLMELTCGPGMKTLWNRKAHETLEDQRGAPSHWTRRH